MKEAGFHVPDSFDKLPEMINKAVQVREEFQEEFGVSGRQGWLSVRLRTLASSEVLQRS